MMYARLAWLGKGAGGGDGEKQTKETMLFILTYMGHGTVFS